MEEFAERGDLRRMQREQERERRRIRDRERRQSMTQEQRERHLARRRRNYQLRRQRAANAHHNHHHHHHNHHQLHLGANAPLVPLPNNLPLVESSAGEASTSDDLQGVTSSSTTSLDYSVILALPGYALNQGQETLNLGTQDAHQGSPVQLETLAYKPADSARRLRLNQIKHLARNLIGSMVDTADTHQVAVELKTTEDASVGDSGSTPKSLRLNSVKRLARSINAPSKETPIQKDNNLAAEEGVQLLGKESFITSS